MQTRIHIKGPIDASHEGDDTLMGCSMVLHGHVWDVEMVFLYDPLQDSSWPEPIAMELLEELDERHLNDMIKPSPATTYGLAHWIMSRLHSTTRIERVTVTVNALGISVTNDNIRRR